MIHGKVITMVAVHAVDGAGDGMNKPLTATEIRQGWKDLPKRYPEAFKRYELAQATFWKPLIDKMIEILRKRGIKIPKELDV